MRISNEPAFGLWVQLMELLNDEETAVRVAAFECVVNLLDFLHGDLRKEVFQLIKQVWLVPYANHCGGSAGLLRQLFLVSIMGRLLTLLRCVFCRVRMLN